MMPELSADELARYEWQLSVEGFGTEGQRRLKQAAVLVSRVGGVGGNVAMQLAMAGVGRLVLAHAGNPRLNDLNRQLLMSVGALNEPRVLQAARRLRELNPHVEVETVAENISAANVDRLVSAVDIVASCAPLFEERLLMNRAAVAQRKPLVDAAMYEMEIQLTTVLPGRTACLACLFPEPPSMWQRRFPVFGAVAGVVGCLGAVEIIKLLSGLDALTDRMLLGDMRATHFSNVQVQRRKDCRVCGSIAGNA